MHRSLVAAVAAVFVLLAAGCGTSRRDKVSAYFQKVDDAQKTLASQIVQANLAYRNFSKAASSPREQRELRKAEATIRKLRARVASVDAPSDAVSIRRDLLLLLDSEIAFAQDVIRLARYTPRFAAVLTDAGKRGASLQANLKGSSSSQQAVAFGAYADALDRDFARLNRLFPPAVIAPAHAAEVETLRTTAQLCRQIRDALNAHQHVTLVNLINRLADLSSTAARRKVHAAQVRAVKAFNGRLQAMTRLTARIQRERQALERKL